MSECLSKMWKSTDIECGGKELFVSRLSIAFFYKKSAVGRRSVRDVEASRLWRYCIFTQAEEWINSRFPRTDYWESPSVLARNRNRFLMYCTKSQTSFSHSVQNQFSRSFSDWNENSLLLNTFWSECAFLSWIAKNIIIVTYLCLWQVQLWYSNLFMKLGTTSYFLIMIMKQSYIETRSRKNLRNVFITLYEYSRVQ